MTNKKRYQFDPAYVVLDGFKLYSTIYGLMVEFHEDQIKSAIPADKKQGWRRICIPLTGNLQQQLKLIKLLARDYDYEVKRMNETAQEIAPLVQLDKIA